MAGGSWSDLKNDAQVSTGTRLLSEKDGRSPIRAWWQTSGLHQFLTLISAWYPCVSLSHCLCNQLLV